MNKKKSILESNVLYTIIAIIAGFLIGAIFLMIAGISPAVAYGKLFSSIFSKPKYLVWTLVYASPLIFTGLSVAFSFRTGVFNIGAEGQILMGGMTSAALMIYCGNAMPNWLLLLVIFVASTAAGMIWGLIPAVFKAYFNTNETLFTLMLNYVAMQIVTFAIVFWENPAGSNTVGIINAATQKGWFPSVFGSTYGLNVILVMVLTIGMFIYMKCSKQGYEIAVVGESQSTARYAGINVKKVIIRTMMISGAICGFAGSLIVSGASHTISTSTAGGRGFTAIIVAWMSKFNPFAMILVSAFLVFMQQGSIQIASQFGLNENASDIITGILLFFLIGCEFFINYKLEFGKNRKEEA